MGLACYKIWVPQNELYNFLELVNERLSKRDGARLYWPDGQITEFFGSISSYEGEQPHEIAFDNSFNDWFCTRLLCEPDEVLSKANRYNLHESGKYEIGDWVYLKIHFSPHSLAWLDGEGYYARFTFIAEPDVISDHFRISPAIRRLFIDLSSIGNAAICYFECDGEDNRVLFLNGQELDQVVNRDQNIWTLINLEDKVSEKKRLITCQSQSELSAHELMARLEWAQYDKDSGIRAAACKSLAQIKNAEIELLLCEVARNDVDWRVRYVATRCLEEFESKYSENLLFESLYDEDYQVRIASITSLSHRENLSMNFVAELAELISKLSFKGPTMGVFYAAIQKFSLHALDFDNKPEPHHAQIIRKRMAEPDFPFKWEAQQIIESLERKIWRA